MSTESRHTTLEEPAEHTHDAQMPPLRHGEHLTRDEFEQRYNAMPHIKKAELIEGVVFMPSPVRIYHHAYPHAHMITWLGVYAASTPGVELADNGTVRLDAQNEPQPDAMLFIASGGTSHISSDDYLEGAPELVVEVSASTTPYDLKEKRAVYQRTGVQEYLVWQVDECRISWWALHEGTYIDLPTNEHGVIASRVFPGLWLNVAALLADDMTQVLALLQQGLQSQAHAAFVTALHAT